MVAKRLGVSDAAVAAHHTDVGTTCPAVDSGLALSGLVRASSQSPLHPGFLHRGVCAADTGAALAGSAASRTTIHRSSDPRTATDRNSQWTTVDPTRLPRRPSLMVADCCACGLVWAVVVLLHPIERTTIASLRFSATDPTRPLLLGSSQVDGISSGIFAGSRLALRQEPRGARFPSRQTNATIAAFWKRNKAVLLMFAGGGLVGCLVFLWIYLARTVSIRRFPTNT